ncbi:MAG: hypothetical protein ING19_12800 [Azospirillum sp.]|nr:hypothetical protein [Azospirillum sp.]MCA3266935.1 hypothetical protein [Azospirillum sp.]MCZ8123606.1 hypothetical protein [Magnetospirillum sp.]
MTVAAQLQGACVAADHVLVEMMADLWRRLVARVEGEQLTGDSAAEDKANLILMIKETARLGVLERVELSPDLAKLIASLQRNVTR